MWRVFEGQEVSQRKLLRGFDNTVVDGVDGFKDLLRIVDELERVGVFKDWCEKVRKRLYEGKLYFKIIYRDYCREDGSCCFDYCRAFVLSDVSDIDYKDICGYSYDTACGNCESFKSVVGEVKDVIFEYKIQLGKD